MDLTGLAWSSVQAFVLANAALSGADTAFVLANADLSSADTAFVG